MISVRLDDRRKPQSNYVSNYSQIAEDVPKTGLKFLRQGKGVISS